MHVGINFQLLLRGCFDSETALLFVMAWCHKATSHKPITWAIVGHVLWHDRSQEAKELIKISEF